MNGQPWYAWEWLFDTVVAGIHHFTGLNGVVFLCAVLMAITFALVFRMMLARGANLPVAIVMLLLAVRRFCHSHAHAAAYCQLAVHPHLLCFARGSSRLTGELRRLFFLPVIMLAWVNLHGGFLVALVLQGIYLVGALVREPGESLVGREVWTRIRPLAIAGLAMLVATFVNPYGYKLHLHIYQYLSDPFLMNDINEFLSPNFHELPQKCFAVLVLLTILGVAGDWRLGTSQLLVVCFAVYTGLRSTKYSGLFDAAGPDYGAGHFLRSRRMDSPPGNFSGCAGGTGPIASLRRASPPD